jgi:hypothetical protein
MRLKKCVVLQVNDAAVSLGLVVFVSKVQGFCIQITEQTGWGRGERRGVPPLWLAVLADGHLVRGLHWFLGGRPHTSYESRHNWERNLHNFFRIQSCVPTADISFLCTGDPAEWWFLWQFQTCACPTGGPWRRCSCWRICWTTAPPPPPQPGHPRSSGYTLTFTPRYAEVTHSAFINRYLGAIKTVCKCVIFYPTLKQNNLC